MIKLVNRSALCVYAEAPFIAWCHALPEALRPDATALQALGREGSVYLIPEAEREEDFQRAVEALYAQIFETELEAWCEDPDFWPEARSLADFSRWFRVAPQLMTFDLADEPLLLAGYDAG